MPADDKEHSCSTLGIVSKNYRHSECTGLSYQLQKIKKSAQNKKQMTVQPLYGESVK